MEGFPELTIGEVAKRAGIATSRIRYYERIGLLPRAERLSGQRRYTPEILGRLGFISVAQSAGFRLREIKELVAGIDEGEGIAQRMRELSARKLDEIEALLERTKAMKGWLEVARECGCATPEECALFPSAATGAASPGEALRVIRVEGEGCRRPRSLAERPSPRGGPSATA